MLPTCYGERIIFHLLTVQHSTKTGGKLFKAKLYMYFDIYSIYHNTCLFKREVVFCSREAGIQNIPLSWAWMQKLTSTCYSTCIQRLQNIF